MKFIGNLRGVDHDERATRGDRSFGGFGGVR